MQRQMLVAVALMFLSVSGTPHARSPMNPVDRRGLVGSWEATDKTYDNSLRLEIEEDGIKGGVLAIAQVEPGVATHAFAIDAIHVASDGNITIEATDRRAGIRVRASGPGVAGRSRSVLTLILTFSATDGGGLWGTLIEPGEVSFVKSDGTLLRRAADAAAKATQLCGVVPANLNGPDGGFPSGDD